MDFISAEEFFNQPKGIQKVFLNWWEPSIGDLFMIEKTTSFEGDKHNFIECFSTDFEVASLTEMERKRIICPLLTEGQLREFIEDKTKCKVDIDVSSSTDQKYNFDFELWTLESDLTFYSKSYYIKDDDLLKAYWKVALEIAKENVENEYK